MHFTPYLSFAGQCAEAMRFYGEIFGATPQMLTFASVPPGGDMPPLPDEMQDWIMHADLRLPNGAQLMGADMPPQFGGKPQAGVSIAVTLPADTAEAVFLRLAEGGTVRMPFGTAFFSTGFGMCKDRFGTSWMVITG